MKSRKRGRKETESGADGSSLCSMSSPFSHSQFFSSLFLPFLSFSLPLFTCPVPLLLLFSLALNSHKPNFFSSPSFLSPILLLSFSSDSFFHSSLFLPTRYSSNRQMMANDWLTDCLCKDFSCRKEKKEEDAKEKERICQWEEEQVSREISGHVTKKLEKRQLSESSFILRCWTAERFDRVSSLLFFFILCSKDKDWNEKRRRFCSFLLHCAYVASK